MFDPLSTVLKLRTVARPDICHPKVMPFDSCLCTPASVDWPHQLPRRPHETSKQKRSATGRRHLLPAQCKRSVLFDGGKIVDADFKGAPPHGARIVSGAGRTLLPGLIDAHVHAYQDPGLPLLFGVTTQVDMFTAVPMIQEIPRQMKAGNNSSKEDIDRRRPGAGAWRTGRTAAA